MVVDICPDGLTADLCMVIGNGDGNVPVEKGPVGTEVNGRSDKLGKAAGGSSALKADVNIYVMPQTVIGIGRVADMVAVCGFGCKVLRSGGIGIGRNDNLSALNIYRLLHNLRPKPHCKDRQEGAFL